MLHDIAAKLTNTHRLTCHNAGEARGQTSLPAKKVSQTSDGDIGKDVTLTSFLLPVADLDLEDLSDLVNPNDVRDSGWITPADGESTSPLEKK